MLKIKQAPIGSQVPSSVGFSTRKMTKPQSGQTSPSTKRSPTRLATGLRQELKPRNMVHVCKSALPTPQVPCTAASDIEHWSNTGILRPGTLSRVAPPSALCRRANSLSYRSVSSSNQSVTTSDCSTSTGTITNDDRTTLNFDGSQSEAVEASSSLKLKNLPYTTSSSRMPHISHCLASQPLSPRPTYVKLSKESDWASSRSGESRSRGTNVQTLSSLPPHSLITFKQKSLPNQQRVACENVSTVTRRDTSQTGSRSSSRDNEKAHPCAVYTSQKKTSRPSGDHQRKMDSTGSEDCRQRPNGSGYVTVGPAQSIRQNVHNGYPIHHIYYDRAASVEATPRGETNNRKTANPFITQRMIAGRNSEPRSLPQYSHITNIHTTKAQPNTLVVPPYQSYTCDQGQGVSTYPCNNPVDKSSSLYFNGECYSGTTANTINSLNTPCYTNVADYRHLGLSHALTAPSPVSFYSGNPSWNRYTESTLNCSTKQGNKSTLDATVVSSPTIGNILRLPGKQTSLDGICSTGMRIESSSNAVGAVSSGQGTNNPPPKLATSLPSSNSAASSLSAGDEKTFCDSGISSSAYSKDSACTSPSDQLPGTKPRQTSEEFSLLYGKVRNDELTIQNQSTARQANWEQKRAMSVLPNSYSTGLPTEMVRARSSEPAQLTNSERHISSADCIGAPSKLQRPTTIAKPINNNSSILDHRSKLTSRQKARDLYSLVKSREEKRTQHAENERLVDTEHNTFGTRPSESNPNMLCKSCVNPTMAPSQINEICNVSNAQSYEPMKQQVSDQTVEDLQKILINESNLNDPRPAVASLVQTNDLTKFFVSNAVAQGTHQVCSSFPYPRDAAEIPWDKIIEPKDFQHPDPEAVELGSSSDQVKADKSTLKLALSVDQLIKDRSRRSASKSTQNLTNTLANNDSMKNTARQTNQSELTTDLTDPEQLLSSLSKLNFDEGHGNHMWDDSYFSDVESEYAALELLLPFSRSFKGQEATTELNGTQDIGKRMETGYYSDTETILAAKSSTRQPTAKLSSFAESKPTEHFFQSTFTTASSSHVKPTPIASVAPIMADHVKQLGSSHVSLHTPKSTMDSNRTDSCFTLDALEAEITLDADGLFNFDYMKWPRLRSTQSISHSRSNDKVMETNGSGEVNLPQPGVLDHIKLPYPKLPISGGPISGGQPVRTSASNYALNQKAANSPTTSLPENPLGAGPSLFQLDKIGSGRQSLILISSETQQEMERLKEELKRSTQQINELTAQLKEKNLLDAETGENMETLTVRVQQLTTLNKIKDSEIHDLKSTVHQLRCDITKLHVSNHATKCIQPRPPRSNSCRTIPDSAKQPESNETTSLSSLVSGVSGSSSQDTNSSRIQSPGLESLARNSPSPNSDGERTPGKRSRWIRPALGRAFKKRSKSSMNTGEHSAENAETYPRDSAPTATVCNNAGIVRNFLPPTPDRFVNQMNCSSGVQADQSAKTLLLRMRWELSCLEADNQRLRRLILNTPQLTDPPDGKQTGPNKIITFSDLSNRHCDKGDYILNVFVEIESSPPRDALLKWQNTAGDSDGQHMKTISQCPTNKLMKIGCVGLSSNSKSWVDLDNKIAQLLKDYLAYLAPSHELAETQLSIREYMIQCTLQSGSISNKKLVRYWSNEEGCASMRFDENCKPKPDCSLSTWINDHLKMNVTQPIASYSVIAHVHGSCLTSVPNNKLETFAMDELTQLNLLSFETLIPVALLKNYMKKVREHRFVILCGPTGTRKTRILHKVAELLVQKAEQPNSIRSFFVKTNGSTMVKELHCFVAQHLATFHRHGIPQVLILENLHHVQGSLIEMLETLSKNHPTPWPVILATSDLLNDELKTAETRFSIHFIEHLTDLDSTASYLSSYLRRKLAQARLFLGNSSTPDNAKLPEIQDETLTQLVTWIPKVWKHLNQLSNKHQQSCPAIFGLRIFLACPIDLTASKHWFTDLWNNLFIPFLFKTRSIDEGLGAAHTVNLSDSFDWIMATWPWPREKPDISELALNNHVNELIKLADTSLYLPPSSFPSLTSNHNSFTTKQHVNTLANNRSSQDSGIISDGYLNLCGPNLDKRSSKGSEMGDRVYSNGVITTNSVESPSSPCVSSLVDLTNNPSFAAIGSNKPKMIEDSREKSSSSRYLQNAT